MHTLVLLAGIAAAVAATPAIAAQSKSKIKVEVENTGVVPDASGTITCSIKEQRSKMTAKFRKLAPATTYDVVVGGVPQASFTTSSSGSGKAQFMSPPKPGKAPLDFDPRGAAITIDDSASTAMQVVLSGGGEPGDILVDERVLLVSTGLDADGKAEARYRSKKGRRTFKVEIQRVPAGAYGLFVDGVLRAVITVGATGKGEVEFDSEIEPGKLPLDFDPRGLPVDVSQGADVFFSASLAAPGQGVTQCTFSESEAPLASTGADPDASGKARFRVRDDCDQDFRVEIEDVPVGDYDLVVGGVDRGTITVVDTGLKIEGELEFDTDPDDPGEVLLTFDPRGQTLEVVQGATVYFSNVFDGTPTGGSSACTPTETELPLLNAGPDPDAKGKARFRVRDDCDLDFRVEIEDLPLGDYDLRVGGVSRGTITVVDTGLEIEGELEFDTDPNEPGEVLLTFDPRGALVEVSQGGTVFLSRVFDGSAGGGGGTCGVFDQELDLVNVGPDLDAKGKARYRAEVDCDADFRVEIEDLPLGDYDLLVGGVHRGTITVALVLGEAVGELEFDTDPDQPGEVLLTFDPRGQNVEIAQGGTVFLSVSYPAS
jgi:hypothetical protein